MIDELTTEMHEEFSIDLETEKKHTAFAVFELVSDRIGLLDACKMMKLTIEHVRPFVAEWNMLSTKQITFD